MENRCTKFASAPTKVPQTCTNARSSTAQSEPHQQLSIGPAVVSSIQLTQTGDGATQSASNVKIDPSFAEGFEYITNFMGDRYYMDGDVKIKRDTVTLLKNMNINVLQSTRQFDYSFISKLLVEVFESGVLSKDILPSINARKIAYANLDETKYKFIESVFTERVKGKKDAAERKNALPSLINRKCAEMRKKFGA